MYCKQYYKAFASLLELNKMAKTKIQNSNPLIFALIKQNAKLIPIKKLENEEHKKQLKELY